MSSLALGCYGSVSLQLLCEWLRRCCFKPNYLQEVKQALINPKVWYLLMLLWIFFSLLAECLEVNLSGFFFLHKPCKSWIICFNCNLMVLVAKLLEGPSILLCPVPPASLLLVYIFTRVLSPFLNTHGVVLLCISCFSCKKELLI